VIVIGRCVISLLFSEPCDTTVLFDVRAAVEAIEAALDRPRADSQHWEFPGYFAWQRITMESRQTNAFTLELGLITRMVKATLKAALHW
jgi:hypothetical protein